MERYEIAEAAERAGVNVEELSRLVELGNVKPDAESRCMPGHLSRAGVGGAP